MCIDVEFRPIYDIIADPGKKRQLEKAMKDILKITDDGYSGDTSGSGYRDTRNGQSCTRFNVVKLMLFILNMITTMILDFILPDRARKKCAFAILIDQVSGQFLRRCVAKCDI